MTNESGEPTRRKHRSSSPDVGFEETTKRRKHHHHHHRKHRHHRRSHKHDVIEDATKVELDEIEAPKEECNGHNSGGIDGVVVGEVGVIVNGTCLGLDYDMEEGEIIEEDVGSAVGNGVVNFDSCSMGDYVSPKGENNYSYLPIEDYVDQECRTSGPMVVDLDDGKDSTISQRIKDDDEDQDRRFEAEMSIDEHGRKDNGYDVGRDKKNLRSSLSSESGVKNRRSLSSSPSHERRHNEQFAMNSEKSLEHSRGRSRSRSRSVYQGVLQSDTPKDLDHVCSLKRKGRSDSDNEQLSDHNRNYRHRSRDHLRNKVKDQNSGYNKHMSRLERHHSRGTTGRVREGSMDSSMNRSLDREGERERIRERDKEREKDRDMDRDRYRERERRMDREREDRVRRKEDNEKNRYRSRYGNRDVEVAREQSCRKYSFSDVGYGDRDGYNNFRDRRQGELHGKEGDRKNDREKVDIYKENFWGKGGEEHGSDEDEQEDYQDRVSLQLANQVEDDLEKIKEESRRRREAILQKYNGHKLQQKPENKGEYSGRDSSGRSTEIGSAVNGAPESADARVEASDGYDAEPQFLVGKSPQPNGPGVVNPSDTVGLGAGPPKSEISGDMFCDDIFGESPAGIRKTCKGDGLLVEKSGFHDNWDDAEGYYSYRFGEILDSRYEIIAAHGKGVFSTVIRAKDLKGKLGDPEEVAIKIIRSNDTMYKAGMDEMVVLKKLVGADPENKCHCVRFFSSFKYRNHLCLVFESLHMNLREVLKKFGRNIGLKLTAVRAYAKQLFIALKHLKNCGVLHCDIKPDNMLVNEAKNVLKLSDFGNAMFSGKNEITPYLVSRFYRAPEIILGLPYDHPMDMWSVGCCLFELFTGKVLFPGPSNNDMLRLHMELKGPFPKKMLRKGAFTVHHFDQDLNFLATEEDPVTKKAVKRLMLNVKPKDVGSLIVSSGEDPKMLADFKDLLEKIFVLDPEKRITVSQALCHPFITGK